MRAKPQCRPRDGQRTRTGVGTGAGRADEVKQSNNDPDAEWTSGYGSHKFKNNRTN